jgi:two-component system CheB/CheR fusion protein
VAWRRSRKLLQALPEHTGMAFVLIQHLDPVHDSKLADLLAKATRMPVREVTPGLTVQPDHVYVIAPNTRLTLGTEGALLVEPRGEGHGPHLPIDLFFKSLAEQRQGAAIGVVLSGTGSDGTRGIEEIKAAGGITLAQDEASARYTGMPQSALHSGCIDWCCRPRASRASSRASAGIPTWSRRPATPRGRRMTETTVVSRPCCRCCAPPGGSISAPTATPRSGAESSAA